jgi:hypothetical protein
LPRHPGHNPILIFLDSDDLLFPHAAATIAERWTTATVKMQKPYTFASGEINILRVPGDVAHYSGMMSPSVPR